MEPQDANPYDISKHPPASNNQLARPSQLQIFSSQSKKYINSGRANPKSATFPKTENEEKMIMRSQIGSRPPRCERRCSNCGRCEAIQVPTNPQVNHGNINYPTVSNIVYARGDDWSNYKPMSWKANVEI
ncbi:hypothetical protein GH714_016268 [Hevea brasiliensis]|uniref:Epidermal patterning factor-like protein n=1 Tax=Hevea brasiliensis TaxID=3981 RepID=A0A6A6K5M1_HEVBR|nr:hypothetical protein GH714_016268 [Hevea brasiliensis]